MTAPWFVKPEDVEDYELIRDGTNSFSWKRAQELQLACDRHPHRGRDQSRRELKKRIICHTLQEEAKPPSEVGGWI